LVKYKYIKKRKAKKMQILAQTIISIGYLIFFYSRFRKDKKSILLMDNLSRTCSIVGYIIFGSVNSLEHTLYGMLRNFLGSKLICKSRKMKILTYVVMLMILFVMYGVSFNGLSTIMFILSAIINLTTVIFLDEQKIRLGTLLAAVCNVTAFAMIGSYVSIVGEAACGVFGLCSYLKFRKDQIPE
jgi:hypothetical protein